MELTTDRGYLALLQQISDTYTQGRMQAVQVVNTHITQTYWQVGQQIVEFEQGGKARAEYGKALISRLASDLSLRHGKGFSRTNLVYMRLLYQRYPISQKPSHLLSWSHYVELLKLDAMTLVAACARTTWARGRFGINFGWLRRLAVFGVGFQYARASARRGSRQAEAFWILTPITAGSLAAGAA